MLKKTLKHKVTEIKLHQASCLQINVLNSVVLCIYRSPSNPNTDQFIESLSSHLESIPTHNSIIVTGDININIRPKPQESPQQYRSRMNYLDMLASYGILAGHALPTRIHSCLDHFMLKINKIKYKAMIAVMHTSTTDHFTTLLSISKLKNLPNHNKNKQTINFEAALIYLQNKNLAELLYCDNPTLVTNNLIDKLIESLRNNTSVTPIPCSKRIIQPWVSPGILRCIRNRNRLQKNVRKDPHNETLRITYRRYRNYCNKLIKNIKRKYDRDNIIKSLNNNKLLWNNIKNITYTKKSQNSNSELLHIKSSPAESANFLNNYFANIGSQLANNIKQSTKSLNKSLSTGSRAPHSFVLLPTDINEVKNIILNLKPNSAPGWDNVPNEFLRMAADDIAPIITHLANLCFEQGIFPTPLKQSIITPVYKGGNKDDISNYRPISVLPAVSKVLEKLLNIRLLRYLDKFNILSSTQFGFRQGRSTEDAIIELTSYVTANLDQGKKCLSVFLDLKKAFDTVSIPLLVNKLESIGVRGTQLALFKSYLSERQQKVKLPGCTSENALVTFGVPQGSVLGPTLFLIYINDLCAMNIPNAKVLSYADDTAVIFSGETWEVVKNRAESGLTKVALWLQKNLLTLNASKTNFICFSIYNNAQPQNNFDLHIHTCNNKESCDCPSIRKVCDTKYLGIIVDQKLSWYQHLEYIIGRVRKLIWIFKILRHIIPDKDQTNSARYLLNQIYVSLVQSVLMYCIPVWGGAAKMKFLHLERAQRSLIKVMYLKKRRFPTEELYHISGLLSVRKLYIVMTILKAHKSLAFDPHIANKRRRNIVIRSSGTKTVFATRQFQSRSVYLYNKINSQICIYDKTTHDNKKILLQWFRGKTYDETELFIQRVS